MKNSYALASLVGVALAVPQGVTDKISPPGLPPAGCTKSFGSKFEITVALPHNNKRSLEQLEKRAECGANGVLVMSLNDSVTLDAQGRVGYIASNFQFQFDKPPQAGALYTSGFSMCDDNTLALGDSKVFYRCKSGDFYNLYNKNWAKQCEPVHIVAMPCGPGSDSSSPAQGNTVGTTMAQTTIITALSDGQPQVVTTQVPIPLCQIGDGQVQVHTTPCASVTSAPVTDSPAPTPTNPVSQIPDGQIQVPPPASTPAGTGPAGPAPTGSAPAGPAPTGPAPTGPAPTGPAPTGPAPTGSAPAGSVPTSGGSEPTGSGPVAPPPSSVGGEGPSGTAPEAPGTTSPVDSAPSTAGSSQVTASISALLVGAVFAFFCL